VRAAEIERGMRVRSAYDHSTHSLAVSLSFLSSFPILLRAWSSRRDEYVAVKKLRVASMNDREIRDFQRELGVMHHLPRHAHIVSLLGCVVDQKTRTYLMVLEWMEGGSLYDFLRNSTEESLPLLRRLQLALQCARAVNHLHQLPPPHGPVLHRDLKSLNFLLDAHGDVKVCQ
jgi:serine/threonine protein kinase